MIPKHSSLYIKSHLKCHKSAYFRVSYLNSAELSLKLQKNPKMGNKTNKFLTHKSSKDKSQTSLLFTNGVNLRPPSAVASSRNKSYSDPTIFSAIDAGDAMKLKRLIKSGHNINKVDINGLTPLHCAALNGNEECVRILIDAGCVLKSCQLRLSTLHFAAQNGNAAIINMLIDYGEIVNAKDMMGDTPLSAAVEVNNIEAAKTLISRGARLHSHVVVSAIENGFHILLKELINSKPDIIWSINLGKFRFTRMVVKGLKLLYFAGYHFSDTFRNETQPLDWYDFCLSGSIRLPPAHYNRDVDARAFQEFCLWLDEHQPRPLSLKCLSRIAFRKSCRSQSVETVLSHYNLPSIITSYILLDDVC